MIHRDIIETYGAQIRPGTGLVLKNLAIIVSRKVPYVNITVNNLVTMFCQNSSNSFGVTATRVHRVTRQDLDRLSAQIERENRISLTATNSSPTLGFNNCKFKFVILFFIRLFILLKINYQFLPTISKKS
jgi:hypothetical protein